MKVKFPFIARAFLQMGYSVDGRHRDNILDDNVPVENQPAWFDGYMFTQE